MAEGEGEEFFVVVGADVIVGMAMKGAGDESEVVGPVLLVEAKLFASMLSVHCC